MGYGVGREVSEVFRLGRVEHPWYLCAFPLVMLFCSKKVINNNCGQGCEGKLIP